MPKRIATKLGLFTAAALTIGGASTAHADECNTFTPDQAKQESTLVIDVVSHRGYSDDGSLRWPNGKTMVLRHHGYSDDGSVFWPNGKPLLKRHSGYSDDHSVFWPSGNTMLKRHSGYSDDGSTFHSDGSPWLVRHSGYSDDNTRHGGARSRVSNRKHSISARLDGDEGVRLSAKTFGDEWVVTIKYTSDGGISITECFTDDTDDHHRGAHSPTRVREIAPKPSHRPRSSGSSHRSYSHRSSYSSTTVDGRTRTRRSETSSRRNPTRHRARVAVDFEAEGSSPASYDDCVNWAYKEYYKSLSSASARDAARKNCKNVNLEVARLLQPYYYKSLSAASATNAALKKSSSRNLANRLDVLEFAMKAYYKSVSAAAAASAAAEHVAAVPRSKNSRRLLSCLQTEYKIYYKSVSSSAAISKAFEVCGK